MLLKVKKRELTEEEQNFKNALLLGGISTEDETLVQALRTFKAISEKGGDFNLRDAAKIEAEMKELYPEFPRGVEEERKEKDEKPQEVTDEDVKSSL